MKRMCGMLLGVGVLILSASLARAAEPKAGSAEAFYNQAVRSATPKGPGTGEQFCWNANFSMGTFVRAYQAWHNPEWLDYGVKFYDFCISKMMTGPDGYKGWIGPFIYQKTVWCDVHVGDSILADNMLEFAELVLADKTLKKKYGEAAGRYVELARKHVIEKWDHRGTWREDGPYGAYVSWDTYCQPEKLDTWTKMAAGDEKTAISLPFNKQNDMALVCLKLYRITGEKMYRDKAEKIYAFMRSRFQFVGDHYVWNYWEPFGPWDVDLATGKTRHWMNVHGYRNYQAGEIGQIVEAYHTGVVFTKTDIERIINTNLKVMWNGDKTAPKFVNSNADLPVPAMTEAEKKARAEAEAANPYAKEGRAGCLWTGLLDFDPTIRELYALQVKGDQTDVRSALARDYFEKVTLKRPAGFERRHVEGEVMPPERPVSECRSLTVAAVMPSVVKAGTKSIVLCKARVPVELEVAVYSADGKEKKLVLHKGPVPGGTDGMAGIFILQWDGSDPAGKVTLDKGDYRLRWTVPDGHREFAVTLQ